MRFPKFQWFPVAILWLTPHLVFWGHFILAAFSADKPPVIDKYWYQINWVNEKVLSFPISLIDPKFSMLADVNETIIDVRILLVVNFILQIVLIWALYGGMVSLLMHIFPKHVFKNK